MNNAIVPNPGGIIDPQNVVGRDRLIADIWQRLAQQSIILSAERRMGKTTVIKKMKAETGNQQIAIYRDLEGITSVVGFVEALWEDVEQYLSRIGKTSKKVQDFLRAFQGVEIKGFKIPAIVAVQWKRLLSEIIADLLSAQESQVVFFWDEVPYLLDNISKRNLEEAMQLLDVLRSLRHNYPQIRMVFTGSIGLHHIVNKLRESGYSKDPTNDMYAIDVTPLSSDWARDLAVRLIRGTRINTSNLDLMAVAQEIAESMGCIPFYIHHLVYDLRNCQAINSHTIQATVNTSLVNPQNSWKMEHYRDRIDNYYQATRKSYALHILDTLAIEVELSLRDIYNRLSLNPLFSDRANLDSETVRDVVRLLLKDYYLIQVDKTYRFRYPLVQSYWAFLRGV